MTTHQAEFVEANQEFLLAHCVVSWPSSHSTPNYEWRKPIGEDNSRPWWPRSCARIWSVDEKGMFAKSLGVVMVLPNGWRMTKMGVNGTETAYQSMDDLIAALGSATAVEQWAANDEYGYLPPDQCKILIPPCPYR